MPPHSSKVCMRFFSYSHSEKTSNFKPLSGHDTHKVVIIKTTAKTGQNWGYTLWVFLQLF